MSSAGATPGHLVWRPATKWRTAVDRALDPLGLTHAQYVVLSSLVALDRLLEPLGGRSGDHTAALSRDLTALLNVPLD